MQAFTLIENTSAPLSTTAPVKPGKREFDLLLQELRPAIFNYCKRYLRNDDDAEEACQDTMLKALQAWSSFEGRASVKTWLYRIAGNECANYYRQRSRFSFEDNSELPDESCSGMPVADDCQFDRFLAQLNVQERNVLSFRFVDDLQLPEIAASLDINISTVKMCYYRALDKFQVAQAC